MIAQNDNQTAADFKAGHPVNPCASMSTYRGPSPAGGVLYEFVQEGREWLLIRTGMTFILPEMRGMSGPKFMGFATAGAPHRWCPPHHYTPPSAAPRGQAKKVGRPGFIRGVVAGESQPSQKPAPLLRAI